MTAQYPLRHIGLVALLALTALASCSRRHEKQPDGTLAIRIKLPPLPEGKSTGSWLTNLFADTPQPVPVALALRIADDSGKTLLTRNLNLSEPYVEMELMDGQYLAEAEVYAAGVTGGKGALCTTSGANTPQYASATRVPFTVNETTTEIALSFAKFEAPTLQPSAFLRVAGDTSSIVGYTFLHNLTQQPVLNACAATTSAARPYHFFPLTTSAGIALAKFPLFAQAPLTLALVTSAGTFLPVQLPSAPPSATAPMFASYNTQTNATTASGLESDDFDGDKVSNTAEVAAGEDPLVADTTPPVITIGAPSKTVISSAQSVTFPITVTGATTVSLTSASVSLTTTGTASCTHAVTNGTTAAPTITLSNCTGSGTVAIAIAASAASDASGNTSVASSASAPFTVDNTPPSLSLATPNSDGCSALTQVSISATATIETGLTVTFEQASGSCPASPTTPSWQNFSTSPAAFSFTTTGGDGNKTLCGWARDALGNVSMPASTSISIDTTVVAASLCAGSTVCGVAGSRQCVTLTGSPGGVAAAGQLFSGTQCLNTSATVVTGSMPSLGALNAASAFSSTGYYSTVTNVPAAASYSAGRLLGGSYGAAIASPLDTPSLMLRDVGTTQTPQSQLNMAALPSDYRLIPKILLDDDGYHASSPMSGAGVAANSRKVIRGTSVWNGTVPRLVCGKDATTIASKISDCAAVHATKPNWDAGIANQISWNGAVKGMGGEGTWTLVTVYNQTLSNGATCGTSTSTCYEVWRDDRTGLLWSDTLANTVGGSTSYNWCKASGSNFSSNASNPYREDDPNNVCDSVSYQNQTQSPAPESLCFEDSTWLSTPSTTAPMKGGMHRGFGGTAPATQVKWRLPAINDFNRAELHGIRFVLPNIASYFWSASVHSGSRDSAWQFIGYDGYVDYSLRSIGLGVRCVGGP